jgi:hypothetical protein
MKKLTKKQMKKLKGKLNEMNYNLNEPIIPIDIPPSTSKNSQSEICKAMALRSDVD